MYTYLYIRFLTYKIIGLGVARVRAQESLT